ncbi:cytochrome P450 [Crossiella equi]|uniref:Cytochrome P450 n=1 Tax=Crossiella equi TaxID=130796 RepID=A0ABS5ALJ8_9PSEU|nr:cytochrome P450 [Crossiella equi]MBP2476545.1 cytochrome P450 [Crossiella equi]
MAYAHELRLAAALRAEQFTVWLLRQFGDVLGEVSKPRAGESPYPLYAALRAREPLLRSRTGLWTAARYRTANALLRDRRFGVRGVGGQLRAGAVGAAADGLDLDMALGVDPPVQTRMRRLMNFSFAPSANARYRDRVERTVERVVDRAEHRGSFDLVTDFAQPIPLLVITDIIGVPPEHRERVSACATRLSALGERLERVGTLRAARALLVELKDLFAGILQRRRAEGVDEHPTDLVGSLLLTATREEVPLAEMQAVLVTALIAGSENTVNSLGNAVLALLAHPGQWDRLVADPDLALGAFDEAMRYDAATLVVSRTAHEDLEFEGTHLPADSTVLVLLGAANHDPERFEAPERFDITRANAGDHLTFTAGRYFCVGAPLSRLEGELALRALARRLPGLRRAGDPVHRRSAGFRGLAGLPLVGAIG